MTDYDDYVDPLEDFLEDFRENESAIMANVWREGMWVLLPFTELIEYEWAEHLAREIRERFIVEPIPQGESK